MVYLDTMPLRWGHFKVLITTAMGQYLAAALATIAGVVIPLLALVRGRPLGPLEQGLLASMELVGIMFGSFIIGKLADKDGYLPFLRLSSVLVFIGASAVYFTDNSSLLIPCLFLMGFGIGGDFALDSDYISEMMPTRWKETMVGIAKAFSALGYLSASALFIFLLDLERTPRVWDQAFLFVAIVSFFMIVSRIFFPKSPGFLIAKGKYQEAEATVKKVLGQDVEIRPALLKPKSDTPKVKPELFKGENLKKVIFSGVPWGCSGLGVYGIGIFLPILIMSLGIEKTGTAEDGLLFSVTRSVELTFVISLFILCGFVGGLFLLKKLPSVKQQYLGFFIAAFAIFCLLLAYLLKLPAAVSIGAFVLFELALSGGPNLTTFIMPSLVFPLDIKAEGAGCAAFFGKLGAVIAVFIFPVLMKIGGVVLTLSVSALVLCAGAVITKHYARELGIEK